MSERRKNEILARMKRLHPQADEELKARLEAGTWHAVCPKCGTRVEGSLAKVKEHRCDNGEPS